MLESRFLKVSLGDSGESFERMKLRLCQKGKKFPTENVFWCFSELFYSSKLIFYLHYVLDN